MSKQLLIPLFLFVCFSTQAATISGLVMDEGEPVVMASVMLVDSNNNVILKQTATDKKGFYTFSVNSGNYKIGVFASNYADMWIKNIFINNANTEVDIQLTPRDFVDNAAPSSSDDCD